MAEALGGVSNYFVANKEFLLVGAGGSAVHLAAVEPDATTARPAVGYRFEDRHYYRKYLKPYDRVALAAERWARKTLCGREWGSMERGEAGPLGRWDEEVAYEPTCGRCLSITNALLPQPEPDVRTDGVIDRVVAAVDQYESAFVRSVPQDQMALLRGRIPPTIYQRLGSRSRTFVVEGILVVADREAFDATGESQPFMAAGRLHSQLAIKNPTADRSAWDFTWYADDELPYTQRFRAAVGLFRRSHPSGMTQPEMWDGLEQYSVRLDPQLTIRKGGNEDPVEAPTAVNLEHRIFWVRDLALVGHAEGGGRIIASFLPTELDEVAEDWKQAWVAAAGEPSGTANREAESEVRRSLVDPRRLRLREGAGEADGDGVVDTPRKKRPVVELIEPRRDVRPQRRRKGPRSFTDRDREDVGLELLRALLGAEASELVDLRDQPGVGADAMDGRGRYYELKVHAGPEPDHISLTASEVLRALKEPDAFHLVVVANVEATGRPTALRLIRDPLRRLAEVADTSVTLVGVREIGTTRSFDEVEED